VHSVPVLDCPFDETVTTRLERAREAIERGLVEPEEFDERNRNLTPEQLYAALLQIVPEHESLAVVHGDATFDNLLIDDEGKIGFIDCGHAGRGDRYLDLATAVMDIREHFGPDWIARFAAAYDRTRLDMSKLNFFSDLYELF
jgi:aminoglycoside phosphotransferase